MALDLQKIWENSFHVPHEQVPCTLICVVHLLQLMTHHYSLKSQIFLVYLTPFCIPGSLIQDLYMWSSCILRILLAVTFSQTFLVFDDLDSFEECCTDIVSDTPLFEFVWYYSCGYIKAMNFLKEDHRVKMPLSSHHIKHTYNQHDLWCWSYTPG